jgi:hypothetical protein
MFFKKGLKDSDLIHKLAMKHPRTSEEMLSIANKYAWWRKLPARQGSQRRTKS